VPAGRVVPRPLVMPPDWLARPGRGHVCPGPGKRILVCGPGTIGLLTTAFAMAMGAEVHVWALGRDREELAASFGASGYWTADDPPPLTYDAVIDGTKIHIDPCE
jgi:D-arabinose 1-dehydrogenase-like Zn-dependent alcohol dehydrogenase